MAATITTNALNALLEIRNGNETGRWNYPNGGAIGSAVSLTYSFLNARPAWATEDEVGFGVMDAAMQAATQKVLKAIAEVANITFTKVGAANGQLTFATSAQGDDSSAWAYPPWFNPSGSEPKLAGSVWVNNDVPWQPADWQRGEWGYTVLLHEIGHALGLKHPFEDDGRGGGFVLENSLDNEAHTVMSYTSAPRTLLLVDTGAGVFYSSLSATTLMPLDIEALQHLYGANTNTRAGATVYKWATNAELLETIWDGGGKDTINCSNQVFSCNIDLRAGAYSSIGLRVTDAELIQGLDLPGWVTLDDMDRAELYNGENNVAIAKGVTIENATGGKGSDVITGNNVANKLVGNAGRDQISGGGGNDILVGGAGADRLNGGAGRDVFDYNRLADVGNTRAKADTILGFVSGQDRIDLSGLDADTTLAGNQAFTFIGASAFSAAGQLRFEAGVLYGSIDADTDAEFMIKLNGVGSLAAGDLVL